MKKSIFYPVFSLFFVFIAICAFSQNNDDIYAEAIIPVKAGSVEGVPANFTNLNEVLKEVGDYLGNHVEVPETMGFYNTDMTVMASFNITENGEIKNISISSHSDKSLGKVVIKELEKLNKITPIKEDGKTVEKFVSVPVVFKVN